MNKWLKQQVLKYKKVYFFITNILDWVSTMFQQINRPFYFISLPRILDYHNFFNNLQNNFFSVSE
jgi:hypothetical protein